MAGIPLTPKQRSELAQALLDRGMTPYQSHTSPYQTLGRVLNMIAGRQQMTKANEDEQAQNEQLAKAMVTSQEIGAMPRLPETINDPQTGLTQNIPESIQQFSGGVGGLNYLQRAGGQKAQPLVAQLGLSRYESQREEAAQARARKDEQDFKRESQKGEHDFLRDIENLRQKSALERIEADKEASKEIEGMRIGSREKIARWQIAADRANEIDRLISGAKGLKQNQAIAAGYGMRIADANKSFDELNEQVLTRNLRGRIAWLAPREWKDADRKLLEQAERNMINAQLRRESGAVISPSEFAEAREQYIPQPGDSEDMLKQKRRNRQVIQAALELEAGDAAMARMGNILTDLETQSEERRKQREQAETLEEMGVTPPEGMQKYRRKL